MIKGPIRLALTPETILNKISDFDIFRYYIPDKCWKLNEAICSPIRKDENPSFRVTNKGGNIHFYDFGNDVGGDAFTFVKLMFGLSLDEALAKIDRDFGLGISCRENEGDYKAIVSQYKQPESIGKRYSIIQVVTRKFTEEELEYWKAYHITLEDLRANRIYSIKEVYLNKKRYNIPADELRFGYLFPSGGWWKIYKPNASKKTKWISNVPLTTAYGLENLSADNNTLIVKSLKDYLLCRKVYPYVCQVQNESIAAFNEESVSYIKEHSKEVYLGYDSDQSGKSASFLVTKAFGWKHINTPDRLLPETKDFADWGKSEGLEVIRKHFEQKGLF
jgi:hypothetical protein